LTKISELAQVFYCKMASRHELTYYNNYQNNGGGHGALPQFVLQTKIHPQTLFIQHLTAHQNPSACWTPREI
jgi:hypothetical protein